MDRKYQIFVSSTYNDLVEERNIAINKIMKLRQIPAGMELFSAVGEDQFTHICREIDCSDYYILILGGRYGSLTEEGISFTEREYDYAVSKKIRVLAFLVKDIGKLPYENCEHDEEKRRLLEKFRRKVESSKLVDYWSDKEELGAKIVESLSNVMRDYPSQTYWSRSSDATAVTDDNDEAHDIADFDDEYDFFENIKLFPQADRCEIGTPKINYDFSDPSKAVIVCGNAYVQLETRDGKVEPYMEKICLEYLKLMRLLYTFVPENEHLCMRRIWFDSVNPNVYVYIDHLYSNSKSPELSVAEIKDMFYDGEVLSDGLFYSVFVRQIPVSLYSDHFYINNKEFYDRTDKADFLSVDWSACEFSMTEENENRIMANIKVMNSSDQPIEFKMGAEFEAVNTVDSVYSAKCYVLLSAKDGNGNNNFSIFAHHAENFDVVFEKRSTELCLCVGKPRNIYFEVKNTYPDYE